MFCYVSARLVLHVTTGDRKKHTCRSSGCERNKANYTVVVGYIDRKWYCAVLYSPIKK